MKFSLLAVIKGWFLMAIDINSVWDLNDVEGLKDGPYRIIDIIPHLDCIILFPLTNNHRLRRPTAILLSSFENYMASGSVMLIDFQVMLPTY